MISACPAVPTGPGFLSGLLSSLDCLSLSVAEKSFALLGASGGPGSAILLAAVTFLIVIFGYRMLFGPQPEFGDATSAALKVGIALALVSSWPVVSRVIAGPVINGPAELTGWTGPGLTQRLARADDGIAAVVSWGTGRDDIRSPRTAEGEFTANSSATVPVADAIAFAGARLSFLLTAIGSLGLLKLLTGILIGLAPIFAGLLLFDRTRGIFAGWARALFALIIAGAAVRAVIALELGLLEPWLAEVVRQRQAFQSAPSAALELFAMTMSFSLISVGMIFLIFRFCLAFELPVIRLGQSPWRQSEAEPIAGQNHRPMLLLQGNSLAPDRAVRTVGGLERLDAFRETTRLIQHQPAGATASERAPAGWETLSAGRTGRTSRPTLLAGRRDAKARRT